MRQVWRAMFFALLAGLSIPAGAQSSEDTFQYRWNAHAYYAGGSSMGDNSAGFKGGGGGFEAFVWKRLTVGADVSGFRDNYYTAVGTFGHVGAQVGYHFAALDKERGADPFILFGAGGYLPERTRVAVHGGFGLAYWFGRHVGARVEMRVAERPYGDNVDGVFRVGIAFR